MSSRNTWLEAVRRGAVAFGAILILSIPVRAGIRVSSDLSATSLRVSDTLILRVSASWDGGEGRYRFAVPQLRQNPSLQLTGQTVGGSQRLEGGAFLSEKTWQFTLVCAEAGTTQVVPPVIIYTDTETGVTDSAAVSPMTLEVSPAPPPPFDYRRLLPYALGVAVVGSGMYVALLAFRRRRLAEEQCKLHRTPEEQAAELLEAIKPLKREDRSTQFYGDLEKVILGLWEARAGRRLAGKTPMEVGEILRAAGVAEDECAKVQEVLTQCHHVRFGGGSESFGVMDKSFHVVSDWLKQPVDP